MLLDLDAYQKQEVERVLTEQRATMQAQRKAHEATGERPSFAEMQARREQLRDDTIAKLQNILSELQITKLKLLMEPPAGEAATADAAVPQPTVTSPPRTESSGSARRASLARRALQRCSRSGVGITHTLTLSNAHRDET